MARRPEVFSSELGLRPRCLVAAPPPGGLSQPSMGPVQVPTRALPLWSPVPAPTATSGLSQVWPPWDLAQNRPAEPFRGATQPPRRSALILQRRRNSRPLAAARQGSPFETPGALLGQGRSVPKWHGGLRTLVGSPRAPTCPGRPGRAAGGGGGHESLRFARAPLAGLTPSSSQSLHPQGQ